MIYLGLDVLGYELRKLIGWLCELRNLITEWIATHYSLMPAPGIRTLSEGVTGILANKNDRLIA